MTSFVSALAPDARERRVAAARLPRVPAARGDRRNHGRDPRRRRPPVPGVARRGQDDEVPRGNGDNDKAQLTVVRPSEPYEVQRTKKEFSELRSRMRQWAAKHSGDTLKNYTEPCAFLEAVERDTVAGVEPGSTKKKGFFRSMFKKADKEPEDWAAWLNASIAHTSAIDADACELCDGVQHVPALLARFLLDGYLSDVIM